MEGLKRTGRLSDTDMFALMHTTTPLANDSLHVRHLEVNLNRQVLFIVDSLDHVTGILPISSGSGVYFETEDMGGRYALTPRGKFAVYNKIRGWRKSKLGMLYYPLYIKSGIAIHGANQVPPQPASHGCIRIPMFAAKKLFDSSPLGMVAIVFGENPPKFGGPKRGALKAKEHAMR